MNAWADYVALNDYEAQLLQDRTGRSITELSKQVRALIVTLGARGSMVYVDGKSIDIPSAQAVQVVDPTGCGDAFRGGLLYGIVNGLDWPSTGRLASYMGALKIASRGAQNHVAARDEIAAQVQREFGLALSL